MTPTKLLLDTLREYLALPHGPEGALLRCRLHAAAWAAGIVPDEPDEDERQWLATVLNGNGSRGGPCLHADGDPASADPLR